MERHLIRKLMFTALFTGLLIAGTFVRIPLGPVPVVLTNLFLFLAALFLGPLWGGVSVVLYLFLGALGLPVFSGGGGLAQLAGPTGGYLFGYLLGVVAGGAVGRAGRGAVWSSVVAVILCGVLIYLPGVVWLRYRLDLTWTRAAAAGVIPFLPGDLIKGAAAVGVWVALRPLWLKMVPMPERSSDGEFHA